MLDNNKISLFDRIVGNVAWLIFWTVINGICIALKLWYRNIPKSGCVGGKPLIPIRIAFCENGAGYGGAIISLAAFLEKLPPQFKAVIYTSIGTDEYSSLSKLGQWRHVAPVQIFNPQRLNVGRVPFLSLIDNTFNLLPYALKYYSAFKRDKINLVYLNNDASCNFAAAIAAKFARLPLVLHARGFNCDTKGNKWVLSKVDYCMPVSNAVKDELLKLGVSAKKCTVVPEGLDLNVFFPRKKSNSILSELKLCENDPIITLVGGLVDWKGQDVLLDAAPLIFQKFPKVTILIVGSAYGKDDRFAELIKKRAASPAMLSRVRMLGSRADVADILASSDIVIHASTKPEPFGRTFLEGMALGKAVIASNEGGPLDVICHGVDGLLIEPRNPNKLAEAITRLLTDSAFSAELGKNAVVKACTYSIESHASSIAIIINKVILSSVEKNFHSNIVLDVDA